MEKQPSQPGTNSAQYYRKTFAEQAGISEDQLKDLELQQPKRQRRARRDPIFSDIPTKTHTLSHDAKPQLHISPKINTSRQELNLSSTLTTPKKQPKATVQTTPKVMRTPQTRLVKEPSIPKSVDEFYQNYITFSNRLFKDGEKETAFIETYRKELFELLESTVAQGGIVKVISEARKNQVFEPFLDRFKATTSDEIFAIYKRYLLHFQYQILENYTFKEYHNAVPLFQEAIFVDQHQLRNFLDKTPLNPKYFDYDIMVFRNGQNAIHIDSNTIHLDRVAEHYKNYNIDIRIQKAMDYGFKPRTMRNEPYQMKIGNYRIYQKLCEEYAKTGTKIDLQFIQNLGQVKNLDVNGTTFKDRIRSEQIFFGVNFDPDDGLLFDEINEKVDGTFLGFKQEFDLLSYLDQEVPGCSFPQFYFKVKGVWTGGHQENINMCAVNINHGPDASEWYSMEFKYVEEFRAQLKKEHKMDLYGSQGLWYEKINWFIEQGKYPVKKIIQKKGDIVVSGPGTLHWVRSHGIALQSAWNQFPITLRMMQYAFCRQQENQRISFIRSNTIPLKMLTLKLMNHQPPQLTPQIRKLCLEKVKMWIKKEEQLFEEFYEQSDDYSFEQPRYEKLDDLSGFCTKCRQEILIYFANGKKVEDILCLGCYKKENKNKKKCKRVYVRNNLLDLNLLIRKSEAGKPFNQLKVFISQYVGKVPNELKDYKMDKQSVLIDKINAMNQELNRCDSQKISEFMKKLKSKRIQSEEKDQQKLVIVQKEERMDLQHPKIHEKPQEIKIQQQKPVKKNLSESKYIFANKPTASGWWNLELPQKMRIITEENHQEILKNIREQQTLMIKHAIKNRGLRINYPYFVQKSRYYDFEVNPTERYNQDKNKFQKRDQYSKPNSFQNVILFDDPKFSSDEQDTSDKIKKKVHKNQDADEPTFQKVKPESNQQNKEIMPKSKVETQSLKIKVRQNNSESKKSKKSHKHKKQKSSRSKSRQKDEKQRKKSRSRSPKSSRNQKSQHSESRKSPSGNRRSKSRGQSNCFEDQKLSRHSENQRDDVWENDRKSDRFNNSNNRDYQRGNNEYHREQNCRQGRRNDYRNRQDNRGNSKNDNWGHRNDSRNNNNYRNGGNRDQRDNMRNDQSGWKNNSKSFNNNRSAGENGLASQRNNNFEKKGNESFRGGYGYRGNNYRNDRDDQRGGNHHSKRYDNNNDNSRSYHGHSRYDSGKQERSQHEGSRREDNINTSSSHIQEKSNNIVEEKHEENNFEY